MDLVYAKWHGKVFNERLVEGLFIKTPKGYLRVIVVENEFIQFPEDADSKEIKIEEMEVNELGRLVRR